MAGRICTADHTKAEAMLITVNSKARIPAIAAIAGTTALAPGMKRTMKMLIAP